MGDVHDQLVAELTTVVEELLAETISRECIDE